MNRVMVTYNFRYVVLGIVLVLPVLGSIIGIFDTTTELSTVHLFSAIWVVIIASLVYLAFTNEVRENAQLLMAKNGLIKKAVEWKDITDVADINEATISHGSTIFTKYRKILKIYSDDNYLKIYYRYEEDVDELKELIKSRLKIEIEKQSYKADILFRVLNLLNK